MLFLLKADLSGFCTAARFSNENTGSVSVVFLLIPQAKSARVCSAIFPFRLH
jgi:hypothetical protein